MNPTPAPTPTVAVLSDKAGDLVDQAGASAAGPAYADVVSLAAYRSGGSLHVSITMDGGIPVSLPATTATLTVTIVLVVNGNQTAPGDYWVGISSSKAGNFTAELDDWAANKTYAGAAFPGTLVVSGSKFAVDLPLRSLGDPTSLALQVVTQKTVGLSDVQGEDVVPDGKRLTPTDEWLRVP